MGFEPRDLPFCVPEPYLWALRVPVSQSYLFVYISFRRCSSHIKLIHFILISAHKFDTSNQRNPFTDTITFLSNFPPNLNEIGKKEEIFQKIRPTFQGRATKKCTCFNLFWFFVAVFHTYTSLSTCLLTDWCEVDKSTVCELQCQMISLSLSLSLSLSPSLSPPLSLSLSLSLPPPTPSTQHYTVWEVQDGERLVYLNSYPPTSTAPSHMGSGKWEEGGELYQISFPSPSLCA